jgi:hypothetical protein
MKKTDRFFWKIKTFLSRVRRSGLLSFALVGERNKKYRVHRSLAIMWIGSVKVCINVSGTRSCSRCVLINGCHD